MPLYYARWIPNILGCASGLGMRPLPYRSEEIDTADIAHGVLFFLVISVYRAGRIWDGSKLSP